MTTPDLHIFKEAIDKLRKTTTTVEECMDEIRLSKKSWALVWLPTFDYIHLRLQQTVSSFRIFCHIMFFPNNIEHDTLTEPCNARTVAYYDANMHLYDSVLYGIGGAIIDINHILGCPKSLYEQSLDVKAKEWFHIDPEDSRWDRLDSSRGHNLPSFYKKLEDIASNMSRLTESYQGGPVSLETPMVQR